MEAPAADPGLELAELPAKQAGLKGWLARRRQRQPKSEAPAIVSYWRLYRFADRTDMLLIFLGSVGAVASGCTLPVFTVAFGDVIDKLGTTEARSDIMDLIDQILLWFVWLGLIALVGGYLEMACWQSTSVRQTVRLRKAYLAKVLASEVGYFDVQASPGQLLQGLNEDCATMQKAIGDKMGSVLHNFATFATGMIIAFIEGWDLTLVLVAMLPILVGVGGLAAAGTARVARAADVAYARANSLVTQTLQNIRTVYAFNMEARTVKAYSDELKPPMRAGVWQSLLFGMTTGTTQLVAMCAYAAAMWYGQSRIVAGDYNGGQVITTMFAFIIGGFALGQAAPSFRFLLQGRIAGAKVFQVLDRQPEIVLDAPGKRLDKVAGEVELRDVVFAYPSRPDVPIFNGFCLRAAAGRTVALVGQSGSGKSTVVGLVQRFYEVHAGQVLLDGHDIRTLDLQWYRSCLGLVQQEPTLFSYSIAENIAAGRLGASRADIEAAARAANAHDFIARLPYGYDTPCGERGVALSGGQKQRIAIARAILRDPKVLLLDEATSALDAASERIVQAALNTLMVGRTTLVVAHRLSTVMSADHIAVVNEGAVVEQGAPKELLTNPAGAFATLVAVQRGVPDASDEPAGEVADPDELQDSAEDLFPVAPVAATPDETPRKRSYSGGIMRRLSKDLVGRKSIESGGIARKSTGSGALEAVSVPAALDIEAALPDADLEPVPHGGWLSGGRLKRWRSMRAVKAELKEKEATEAAEEKVKVGYRKLLALNRPEWWILPIGLFASACVGSVNPSFALTLSEIIAVFYLPVDQITSAARKWSIIFAGIGVGAFLMASLQQLSFGAMGQKLGRRVRVKLMRAVLQQEVGYFDRQENSSGAVASRLSADAVAVRGAVSDQFGVVTQFLACLVFGLTVAFISGWRMTLVLLACLPALVASTVIQVQFQMNLGGKAGDGFEKANGRVMEAFSAFRTITAFGLQRHVCDTYSEAVAVPQRKAVVGAQIAGVGFGVSPCILFFTYALGFWYGAREFEAERMDFDSVMRVFLAIFIAAFGLAEVQIAFPDIGKAKGAVQRVFGVIERPPAIADAPNARTLDAVSGELEFRNVSFAYPTRPEALVFKDFCLVVPAAHCVALVGPSGSGKSSVVALVERFYDPLSGQVLLDGVNTRELRLSWLRSQLALVSQDPALFNVSVRENILYGAPAASQEEVEAAARAANAHQFIAALPEGYDTLVGEAGVQLSGGQKQRVAIARAVLRNPRLLLLDEATSALDAESEAAVQAALDTIMVGRTTLVVAHRLSTIRNAHSIAVVHQGQIVEQGKHAELVAKPDSAYAALVRHQMESS